MSRTENRIRSTVSLPAPLLDELDQRLVLRGDAPGFESDLTRASGARHWP